MMDEKAIGECVLRVMGDRKANHRDRAVAATELIENRVRVEFRLGDEVALPIPLEWQHKVPTGCPS